MNKKKLKEASKPKSRQCERTNPERTAQLEGLQDFYIADINMENVVLYAYDCM